MRDQIRTLAELCGAKAVVQDEAYPGWAPNLDSVVLGVAKDVLRDVLGKEPDVLAIHAGLECGIIGEKCPGSDIISYGPTIVNPHTPDEAVLIETVQPFWDLTLQILTKLADR